MITNPVWQWVFSVVFVAIAGYLAWRAVADRRRPLQTIGDVLHLLMALVMAAMAWPWWYSLPWLAQLIIFAFSTLWFLAVGLGQWLGRFEPEQLGCHPAWHQVVHALMMGAMTWMVAVMPPGHGGHGEHAMHTMGTTATVLGIVATALLFVAAVVQLVDAAPELRRRGLTRHVVDSLVMVVMLIGMGAMCWLMIF